MAFKVKKGIILNVHKACSGLKKDGTPWALVTCQENENQPDDLEFPSNSKYTIKFWLDALPEGATNGCCVKLIDFDEHTHTRDVFEIRGQKSYRETCEYYGAELVVVPEPKK